VSRLLRREVDPKIWCPEKGRVEDAVFLLNCCPDRVSVVHNYKAFLKPDRIFFFYLLDSIERSNYVHAKIETVQRDGPGSLETNR
jgi:hypothetical protein